jgi:hypothetical protein
MSKAIYIASKTKWAHLWRGLRSIGVNIISTWIDEAGQGETKDKSELAVRCIRECALCDAIIVYREDGEYLKGAFIEMGAALALDRTVYIVGPVLPEDNVFFAHPNIVKANSVEEAIEQINAHQ